MASTYLTRTFETATNRKKCTISFWIKKGFSSETQQAFCSYYNASYRFQFYHDTNDTINIYNVDNGSDTVYLQSKAKYRDCNAWYHCYAAIDTTLATQTDRVKIYINGERYTDWNGTQTYPSQNADMSYGASSYVHNIGRYGGGNHYVNGILSHYYFVDGSVIDVSQFGSTDTTTGEWKISTNPTIASYGNSGCKMFIDNASVNDQSGNGNNFTLSGGTLTKTEDNPSNVFCTYNPLQQTNGSAGFENGNTYFTNGTQWLGVNGTIAATSGKYYAEFKVTGNTGWGVGVADVDSDANSTVNLSTSNNGYQSKYTGGKQIFLNGSTIIAQENNSTVVNNAGMGNTGFVNNDIVMVALDLDNNNLFFGKNGTWLRGATESEIEAGTSTNATFSGTSFNNKFWTWSVTTELENMRMNAGNGFFSTTAVTSAGTNASGNGIFEYNVPDGFTALLTKGLNL